MQLPSVDRQPGLAPAGADMAVPAAARVIPVAPVNPAPAVNPPSVVNKIGESAATSAEQALTYAKSADAGRTTPEEATSPRDWTIARPEPEKVEIPPPIPMSQQLLEFLQAVWRASASAVEIARAQNQPLQPMQNNPDASPGRLAKEDLTYTSSKIRKNERL